MGRSFDHKEKDKLKTKNWSNFCVRLILFRITIRRNIFSVLCKLALKYISWLNISCLQSLIHRKRLLLFSRTSPRYKFHGQLTSATELESLAVFSFEIEKRVTVHGLKIITTILRSQYFLLESFSTKQCTSLVLAWGTKTGSVCTVAP